MRPSAPRLGDDELLAVGLAQRSRSRPGQVFDRFRERIVFPSADARGRVLGFGARAMRENQRPWPDPLSSVRSV